MLNDNIAQRKKYCSMFIPTKNIFIKQKDTVAILHINFALG